VGFTGTSIIEKRLDGTFVPHLAASTDHLGANADLGFATAFMNDDPADEQPKEA